MSVEKKVYCGPVIRYKMKRHTDDLYDVLPDEPFSRIPVPVKDGWSVAMPNLTIGSEPRRFHNPDEEAWIFDDEEVEGEVAWLYDNYKSHVRRLDKFAEVEMSWGFFVWWA